MCMQRGECFLDTLMITLLSLLTAGNSVTAHLLVILFNII